MSAINFSQDDIQHIIKLRQQDKLSIAKIAQEFNVSVTPIKRILKENDISTKAFDRTEDLTNRRFGKLLVLHRDEDQQRGSGIHTRWICQCDCGTIKSFQSNHLKDGSQSACSQQCSHSIAYGTKFGELTVICATDMRDKNGGSVIYKCECSCGNETYVASTELRAKRKSSCENCSISAGASQIKNLLEQNSISFVREYTFKDCINPETNALLRFDFYLPDYNILIEYDGEQHFMPISHWGGVQGLEKICFRDNIKNNYCKEKGITLIRIPYTHSDIQIEDLLLDSNFILQ